ncbi:Nuclease SbcCD subunit D OS=Cellulomonas persica OX=76861 GN=sbcD PE=3 SV=1 [Cellulomonas persica]
MKTWCRRTGVPPAACRFPVVSDAADTVHRMRMLHTSDWHLGRTLHGVDLLDHQAAYLDHLVDVVRSEQVDAVVVAGDVYDRAIPPVEAVTLLSDTLARLAELTTVVLTSGNHDSATRLGFGAALMRERVALRTRVAGLDRPVEVTDAEGRELLVYGLPYLDPDTVRTQLVEPGAPALARSHEAVTAAAMARVRADLTERSSARRVRSVVAAHAFVIGGVASESERDIRVGGVDHVPSDVLGGVDYVALGHLHGPQVVTGPAGTTMRYSGSPLAYSFSEQRHAKSSVLVDLSGDDVRTELVPAPVPRRLADVTGTLEEVLGAAGEAHVDDWVRVVVTDERRPQDLYARVRARLPHALVVQHRPPETATGPTLRAVTSAADPVEVACDFVAHVAGSPPDDDELAVLRAAYEHAAAAERSA